MMELILKEDVEKLGDAGSKVKVAGGYGRNYLIPQGLALEATPSNLKALENHMKKRAKRLAAIKSQAEGQAAELNKIHLAFTRKSGVEGKLFGSVTATDIYKEIEAKNFEIDKRKILLDMPIKEVGEHKVGIKLHPEVTAEITVEIKAEAEEAPVLPVEDEVEPAPEAQGDSPEEAETKQEEEPE
ncbi:MAG: 50S ribosomal protein L9 [Nitrospinota bacterium]